MAEEKTQGAGTLTEDAPGENTVQVTFLPEGKTVQFEHGKLPYEDHGKEESILDVALNIGIPLDHACGGNCACTTCHIWVKEGAENLCRHGRRRGRPVRHGRRSPAKLASRLPGADHQARQSRSRNSSMESKLRFGRALESKVSRLQGFKVSKHNPTAASF